MHKIITLILLLAVCFLGSCERGSVYHTYYGDIDTDTMVAFPGEGSPVYVVKIERLLHETAKVLGTDSIIRVIYYMPSDNTYYQQLIGNDGNYSGRFKFDPLEDINKELWLETD